MRCSDFRPSIIAVWAALAVVPLTGCDMLGIESSEKIAAARDADGRAIGGACRHAARAIEDCYALNKKADKAAIFAGWRDMNDYMRENKIDAVPSQLAAAKPKPPAGDEAATGDAADKSDKPEKPDKPDKPETADAHAGAAGHEAAAHPAPEGKAVAELKDGKDAKPE